MACRFVLLQLIIFLQFCEIQGNIAERASFWDPRYGRVMTTAPIDGNMTTSLHIRSNYPRLYINFKEGLWRIKGFQVTLDIWSRDSFRFSIQKGDGTYRTCYEESKVVGRTKYTWNITCVTELQGKTLIIENTYNYAELRVYEVIVNSCSAGTYGNDCEYDCPMKCPSDCYLESGQCRTCAVGKYGDNCDRTCSNGCQQDKCWKYNGQCSNGCNKGFIGTHCSPCQDGTYGHNCRERCPKKCRVSSCDHVDGTCSSCHDGYTGDHCLKCRPGRFGSNCHDECDYCFDSDCDDFGQCNRCIAGQYGLFCNTTCPLKCGGDGSCNITSGDCLHGCKPGYIGTRCSSTCSVGCIGSQCDHVTGHCSPCHNGYSGDRCLPCPKGRFGFNCNEECDYCIGSKCDNNGICLECRAGRYGLHCNKSCPLNCGGVRACNITSGVCRVCKGGSYNPYCNSSCSDNCRAPGTCSSSGICVNGCIDGWVGDKCDQRCSIANCEQCLVMLSGNTKCSRCINGWFLDGSDCRKCLENCQTCQSNTRCSACVKGFTGRSCSDECNKGCQNRTCNIQGHCDRGCLPGYYGLACSNRCSDRCIGGYQECSDSDGSCLRGCSNGTYGVECDLPCRKYCKLCYNERYCTKCEDGYYGENCERCPTKCLSCSNGKYCDECPDGIYGQQCDKQCNNNCVDSKCHMSGECLKGCIEGYIGSNCVLKIGSFPVVPVSAGVSAVVLCIFILLIVIWKLRRRKIRVLKRDGKSEVHSSRSHGNENQRHINERSDNPNEMEIVHNELEEICRKADDVEYSYLDEAEMIQHENNEKSVRMDDAEYCYAYEDANIPHGSKTTSRVQYCNTNRNGIESIHFGEVSDENPQYEQIIKEQKEQNDSTANTYERLMTVNDQANIDIDNDIKDNQNSNTNV